jgi:hypothetical protein
LQASATLQVATSGDNPAGRDLLPAGFELVRLPIAQRQLCKRQPLRRSPRVATIQPGVISSRLGSNLVRLPVAKRQLCKRQPLRRSPRVATIQPGVRAAVQPRSL